MSKQDRNIFQSNNIDDINIISQYVTKMINGESSQGFIKLSPFKLIVDFSQYNYSHMFKVQYEEDTRWVAYKLIEDFKKHTIAHTTGSEKFKGNSITNTIYFDKSANRLSENKDLRELHQIQTNLIHELDSIYQVVTNNIFHWCKIRSHHGIIQPHSLNEEFRIEIINYINEAYISYSFTNTQVKDSLFIDLQNNELINYTIAKLNKSHIENRFMNEWYPPTIVDLLEKCDEYKKYNNTITDNILYSVKNGIMDLFRIVTSLDEPNSIGYTRKPIRYPFINNDTILNLEKDFDRNEDIEDDALTVDNQMLALLFEYANSKNKKIFALTPLGRELGLDVLCK